MFTQETNNLCHTSLSDVLLVNSVYNENENILFLRPKMWDTVPKKIKKMKTVEAFKLQQKIENCPADWWRMLE